MKWLKYMGIRFTWYRLIMSVLTIAIFAGLVYSVVIGQFWPGLVSLGCFIVGIILHGMWPYSWPKH